MILNWFRMHATMPNFHSAGKLNPSDPLSELSSKDMTLLKLTENFVKDVRYVF